MTSTMESFFHNTAAVARFSDEKMQKVNLYESPRMFCDVYCLKPGQYQKEHAHEAEDKVYHVLAGTPTVRIGEHVRRLNVGEVAIAPAGVVHGVRNDSSSDAKLLVFMAPHPRAAQLAAQPADQNRVR